VQRSAEATSGGHVVGQHAFGVEGHHQTLMPAQRRSSGRTRRCR
jgi:hypothetical protein